MSEDSINRVKRRDFLKLVGAGSVGVGAGAVVSQVSRNPTELLIPYPVPPEEYMPGVDTWYNTLCQGCSARCGVSVRVREGRVKKIEGNPSHPVSRGGLCARGQAGVHTLYHPDRLTGPMKRLDGKLTQVSWDLVLSHLAHEFRQVLATERGPGVAIVTGSARGHLHQLMQEFLRTLGSSRLITYRIDAQHNLHAANLRSFGARATPYYDIANTPYLLSFGADFLTGWLSPVHYSQAFGDMRQGDGPRGYFVQVEPRMSLAAANADRWLATRPGSEAWLALAICHQLLEDGVYDGPDRNQWVERVADYSPARAVEPTGLGADQIVQLAHDFAAGPGLAIIGGGALHGTNGLLAATAVNLMNYLVGSFDRPGGVLANSPPLFGPEAAYSESPYAGLREIVEAARQGRLEAVILHDVNPLYSAPPELGLREALESVPLVISMSELLDESSEVARFVLPLDSYLEAWGDDSPESGVGFPTASLAQPVARRIHNTKSAGDFLIELAHRLGDDIEEALPWRDFQDFLKARWDEIYRTRAGSLEGFDAFWTATLQAGVWGERSAALGAPNTVMIPAALDDLGHPDPQFSGRRAEYPYTLHPYLSPVFHDGRWAHLPWLQELPDPISGVVYTNWIEIHPQTAELLGVRTRDVVEISSPAGSIKLPVLVYPAIHPDVVAIPMGQGHHRYGRYASGRGANPIEIIASRIDEDSGDLAWAATRVQLKPTGERIDFVTTSGNPRPLGRQILGPADGGHG
ncbi:MAG: molybdopterin-dependent oxidoreductase [Xanthomonadales bacterium]|nr:molybdopterin-dependent oxidoreductase [Xanthomonadales bacterium]